MKRAAIFLTMLVLVLSLTLAQGASAQPSPESSKSYIQFQPGQLVINPDPDPGEVGFSNLQINFGERNVPIRAEVYYADGTSDSTEGVAQGGGLETEPVVGILVNDARSASALTGWKYNVKLTSYIPQGGGTAFDATVRLNSGIIYTNANQTKVGTALVLENGGSFVIATDNQNVTLLTATAALGNGSHGAHWARENISMKLGEGGTPTGFQVITDDNYQAVMTWTLEPTN